MAEQYNNASKKKTAFKKRVLANLRYYVNKSMSAEERAELKKRWLTLRTIPKNWIIPLLSTGSIVKQSSISSNTSQVSKWGKLSIKESSYQRISEEYDFKVYEAEVTATDGDVVLEKIDLVQFWSGEGINIWELYKRDYGWNMLKLTTSKDERVYKFYKREWNPWITFDLFTGLEPGMKIRNGENVKFTITIDSMSFSEYGKDFQRTNIFYVKYKLKSQEALISGDKPQIIVYRACDEWVKIATDSTPIVFDESFNMNLFSTGKVSDRSLDWLAMPVQYYYTRNLWSDLSAYQNDIREKFIDSSTTYTTWLNKKYISGLVDAYQNKQKPWLFMGYKSKVNTQFRPTNGMQCKDIVEVAKAERIAFKTTYDDIVSSFNQDRINQLTERVTELEALNAWCTIKWNVNFDTWEKIYHLPWSRHYSETLIDTLYWERWFCSESDAINAWWRKEQGY